MPAAKAKNKQKVCIGALLFVLFFVQPNHGLAATAPVAYRYEPAIVKLKGVLETQTFPGRPGYESIVKGDEIERGWYLRLDQAIDVVKGSRDSDPNAATERGVKILQLSISSDKPLEKRFAVGKRLVVIGSLFHAVSAHNHSRVLMDVSDIKETNP